MPVEGSIWHIRYRGMVGDIREPVDNVLGSEAAMRALFPPDRGEPWTTFFSLTTHAMLPYRAAGIVLALAYHMEALRNV